MAGQAVVNHGRAESAAKEVLKKIAKSKADPYTQRNKSSVCAFYVRGNCKREGNCPFLHEMPIKKGAAGAGSSKSTTAANDKEDQEKTVDLEKVLELPVPAPVGKDKKSYPSQNPNLLGTATRTFTS